ncbi:hypothetical protein HPB50_011603 [Hyalomma asiaticum]|uniref:Uncharacterized protein n=1 Tax=Hyalomma asiaticum TaxID=266040 RepID=A0ACB7SXQ1_HYAAI|nr:hypothetical protein HPB50_011603 [Hyalomma asiaticum]
METVFGWTVHGPTVSKCKSVNCAQVVVLRASITDPQTEAILRRFWELEGVEVSDTPEKIPNVHIREEFTKGIKTWPIEQQFGNFTPDEIGQKREIEMLNTSVDGGRKLLDLARCSSATKVDRVTAWVLRFVGNLRTKAKKSGPLTAEEIERARVLWIKRVQTSLFPIELGSTENRARMPSDSPLKEIVLTTDSDGLPPLWRSRRPWAATFSSGLTLVGMAATRSEFADLALEHLATTVCHPEASEKASGGKDSPSTS